MLNQEIYKLSNTEIKSIDFAKGDKLTTIYPIARDNSSDIMFAPGTEVTVLAIKKDKIHIELPNGDVQIFDGNLLPFYFNPVSPGEIFTISHKGIGTPPRGIYSLLPKGASWKKNYVWKVHITLEERDDKNVVCLGCTSELDINNEKDPTGKYYCTSCKEYTVAIDCKTGKPFMDEQLVEEIIKNNVG